MDDGLLHLDVMVCYTCMDVYWVVMRAEGSAKAHANVFVPQAKALVAKIERMFTGVSMPRSDSTWTG